MTILALLALGFFAVGCSDTDVFSKNTIIERSPTQPVLGKIVNRTLMKVDKLSCGSCLTAISQKLSTYDGMVGLGADLSRGLVAVDHTKALESKKIADAITSIGYPATVLSVTDIDSRKTFVPSSSGQYGGSCCGGSRVLKAPSNDKQTNTNIAEGCPYSGSVRSRGCYASSASWKKLFEKFSKQPEDTNQ